MCAMRAEDPFGDHWIRVGVVLDGQLIANAAFPPRATVSIGSRATDSILEPEGTFAESFCLLSEGTLIHTLPRMTMRMARDGVVTDATARELGDAFRSRWKGMKITVRAGLSIFLKYVPTEEEAESGRRDSDRLIARLPSAD